MAEPVSQLVSGLITLLIATLFIHWSANLVLDRSRFVTALLVALIGTVLASLVASVVDGVIGLVLAIIVWAAVAAGFYRTNWSKGAIIGVVAWLLFFLVNLLVDWVFTRI